MSYDDFIDDDDDDSSFCSYSLLHMDTLNILFYSNILQ